MGATLGQQIRQARKARSYTFQALADLVGVSKTAVMKWEDGDNSPSVENLIKLEKILDVRFYPDPDRLCQRLRPGIQLARKMKARYPRGLFCAPQKR